MHSRLRKVFLAVVAVAGAALVSTSGAAATGDPVTVMAGCGDSKSATTTGGKASWTVHCDSTQIWIVGSVQDTAADGKCVWVRAQYADGSTWESNRACPKGDKDSFSSPKRAGRILDAYIERG